MSTLPFVLLKTHVYMMAKQVVARTNTTTLNAVSSFQGVKNRGKCHKRPEGTEDQGPEKRTVHRLQPGQRKTAPARLFAKRSS